LIVYSPAVIDLIGLAKHSRKIVVAREHFLNFEQYRFKDDLERRDNVVGFIGRLSEEKGVLNFVQAMPAVLSARSDVTFCLVGEGKLEGDIEAFIDKHALRSKVKLAGFIPHHKLPDYLTRLKLLVVPSYAEGLPNVVLEAMACGTPVLATPVGSVPDVIADKETGFLMRDNSPSSVAQSVVDTLACPDLRRIAVNARTLVEAEFRFEKIEETWKSLIWSAKDE
jgi:glycosyltransferase involved in cell wall biosynthesis